MKFLCHMCLLSLTGLLGSISDLKAQLAAGESLTAKTIAYNATHPNDVLYVTTDKTIYIPTETIWFAGYLIDNPLKYDTLQADILSVALLRDDTAAVSIRKNYLLRDGLCSGSLTLPDTLSPGNYLLLACTNIANGNGEPIHVFRMPLTVKSATIPNRQVDFGFPETVNQDTLSIAAKVHFPEGTSASERRKSYLSYHLLNGGRKRAKLDFSGRVVIALPMAEVMASNQVLYTTTTIGRQTKEFNVKLSVGLPDTLSVRFYPEGGDMVAGLRSRVAWEATLSGGVPAQVNAVLMEDGDAIDTIKTDGYGVGVFHILPQSQSKYTLRMLDDNNRITAQTYPLPPALSAGFTLEVPNAVANDTLFLHIAGTVSSTVSIAITNMNTRESVVAAPILLENERWIRMPLNDVPKGLNILTLLDVRGRPVAERVFFAHMGRRNQVAITMNRSDYSTREKVSATLSLMDSEGLSTGGVFTISCVQLPRLDTIQKPDIASHYYMSPLKQQGSTAQLSIRNTHESSAYLESVLLIKGWRRYLWQQLMQVKTDDPFFRGEKLEISGSVQTPSGNPLKEAVNLLVQRDSSRDLLSTDERGFFSIRPEEITIAEDLSMYARVVDKGQVVDDKRISVDDPMETLIQFVASLPFRTLAPFESTQSSVQQELKQGLDMPRVLETVVVSARGRRHAYAYGANECGDYVCVSGYLNCEVHSASSPDNRPPPVKGQKYYFRTTKGRQLSVVEITYAGCLWEEDKLAIYTAREFYGMDNEQLQNTDEKRYLSTAFWKPFTTVAAGQTTAFDFYTSDLPGIYKVTIEGIAENGDFLYTEKIITITTID